MNLSELNSIPVNIPSSLTLKISHEEFIHLANANRDLQLERTASGDLIIMPPTGSETGNRNLDIEGQLWLWNKQTLFGKTFNSSTGFHLPNGADRSPDATWIALECWNNLSSEEKEGFAPIAPDFVIELRSKTDSLAKLRAKMREYMDNGVRLAWLIDRKNQTVEIYRQNQEVEILTFPSTLSGEDVLPGFILDLTVVWS